MSRDYFATRVRFVLDLVGTKWRSGASDRECKGFEIFQWTEALGEEYERGRQDGAENKNRPLSGNAFDPRAQAIIERKDGGEE